jgi:hypothetical protein
VHNSVIKQNACFATELLQRQHECLKRVRSGGKGENAAVAVLTTRSALDRCGSIAQGRTVNRQMHVEICVASGLGEKETSGKSFTYMNSGHGLWSS